jgi:hypothetical protein
MSDCQINHYRLILLEALSKYGEEERRRTRVKDTSMAREDSSDRP